MDDIIKYPVYDLNGNRITYLNNVLVKKQQLTQSNIAELLKLHTQRYTIRLLADMCNPQMLKMYAKMDEEVDVLMQIEWHFPLNKNYYKFWEFPRCTCPKMDNNDAYPSGHYVINNDCIVHGV